MRAWGGGHRSPSGDSFVHTWVRSLGYLRGALVAALAVAMLGASARPVRARAPRSGYLAKPTEQLALPCGQASAEITLEGHIYSGWAESELAVGARLQPWAQ